MPEYNITPLVYNNSNRSRDSSWLNTRAGSNLFVEDDQYVVFTGGTKREGNVDWDFSQSLLEFDTSSIELDEDVTSVVLTIKPALYFIDVSWLLRVRDKSDWDNPVSTTDFVPGFELELYTFLGEALVTGNDEVLEITIPVSHINKGGTTKLLLHGADWESPSEPTYEWRYSYANLIDVALNVETIAPSPPPPPPSEYTYSEWTDWLEATADIGSQFDTTDKVIIEWAGQGFSPTFTYSNWTSWLEATTPDSAAIPTGQFNLLEGTVLNWSGEGFTPTFTYSNWTNWLEATTISDQTGAEWVRSGNTWVEVVEDHVLQSIASTGAFFVIDNTTITFGGTGAIGSGTFDIISTDTLEVSGTSKPIGSFESTDKATVTWAGITPDLLPSEGQFTATDLVVLQFISVIFRNIDVDVLVPEMLTNVEPVMTGTPVSVPEVDYLIEEVDIDLMFIDTPRI